MYRDGQLSCRAHRAAVKIDSQDCLRCGVGGGQADVGVGGGTYSRRITQANIMRRGAEIEEEDAVLIRGGAGQRHGAAAGGAAEALDLDAVAIEQQNTVEAAEAAGKVVVADVGVLDVETPLQDGLRQRTAGVEVYAQSAARQDFGVERLEERHIDRTVQAEVELFRAGQVRAAVGGEIGSTACEVEIFEQQELIRNLEANDIDTLYLHVRELGAERLDLGGCLQIAWSAQRTAKVERPVHGRVSRDLSRQVSAKKRIGIQMMEVEFQIGGKVML